MWSATMPGSRRAVALTTSRSRVGAGVLDVNLMGVLYGIRTFLPHIRAHGEGGHFVNTASMAGMVSGLGFSAYSASKFAVVTIGRRGWRCTCGRSGSRERAVSRLGSHPYHREWAQPAGALRADADARPREPGQHRCGPSPPNWCSPGSTRQTSPRVSVAAIHEDERRLSLVISPNCSAASTRWAPVPGV